MLCTAERWLPRRLLNNGCDLQGAWHSGCLGSPMLCAAGRRSGCPPPPSPRPLYPPPPSPVPSSQPHAPNNLKSLLPERMAPDLQGALLNGWLLICKEHVCCAVSSYAGHRTMAAASNGCLVVRKVAGLLSGDIPCCVQQDGGCQSQAGGLEGAWQDCLSVIPCCVQQVVGCAWLCLVTRHTVSQSMGLCAIK